MKREERTRSRHFRSQNVTQIFSCSANSIAGTFQRVQNSSTFIFTNTQARITLDSCPYAPFLRLSKVSMVASRPFSREVCTKEGPSRGRAQVTSLRNVKHLFPTNVSRLRAKASGYHRHGHHNLPHTAERACESAQRRWRNPEIYRKPSKDREVLKKRALARAAPVSLLHVLQLLLKLQRVQAGRLQTCIFATSLALSAPRKTCRCLWVFLLPREAGKGSRTHLRSLVDSSLLASFPQWQLRSKQFQRLQRPRGLGTLPTC